MSTALPPRRCWDRPVSRDDTTNARPVHQIDVRHLHGKPLDNRQSAKLKVVNPGVAAAQAYKETHVPVGSDPQLTMLDPKIVTYTLRLFEPTEPSAVKRFESLLAEVQRRVAHKDSDASARVRHDFYEIGLDLIGRATLMTLKGGKWVGREVFLRLVPGFVPGEGTGIGSLLIAHAEGDVQAPGASDPSWIVLRTGIKALEFVAAQKEGEHELLRIEVWYDDTSTGGFSTDSRGIDARRFELLKALNVEQKGPLTLTLRVQSPEHATKVRDFLAAHLRFVAPRGLVRSNWWCCTNPACARLNMLGVPGAPTREQRADGKTRKGPTALPFRLEWQEMDAASQSRPEIHNAKLSDALGKMKREFTLAEFDEFGLTALNAGSRICVGGKWLGPKPWICNFCEEAKQQPSRCSAFRDSLVVMRRREGVLCDLMQVEVSEVDASGGGKSKKRGGERMTAFFERPVWVVVCLRDPDKMPGRELHTTKAHALNSTSKQYVLSVYATLNDCAPLSLWPVKTRKYPSQDPEPCARDAALVLDEHTEVKAVWQPTPKIELVRQEKGSQALRSICLRAADSTPPPAARPPLECVRALLQALPSSSHGRTPPSARLLPRTPCFETTREFLTRARPHAHGCRRATRPLARGADKGIRKCLKAWAREGC